MSLLITDNPVLWHFYEIQITMILIVDCIVNQSSALENTL